MEFGAAALGALTEVFFWIGECRDVVIVELNGSRDWFETALLENGGNVVGVVVRSKFFVEEGRNFAAEFALTSVGEGAEGNRGEVSGLNEKVKSVEKVWCGFLQVIPIFDNKGEVRALPQVNVVRVVVGGVGRLKARDVGK